MRSPRVLFALLLILHAATSSTRAADPEWVAPMKKVHARFTGTPGTLALFGDSITVSMAFWAPLRGEPKGMSKEMEAAHKLVKDYMKPEGWDKGRGAKFGNEGGMTIRWAHENVAKWLKELNPEVAVIMFGTNDLGALEEKEYAEKTAAVVDRCLKNGTIVILTTLPPRSGLLEKSKQFAEAVRRVAKDKKVPLIDYHAEILKRRPDDWDGAMPKFKDTKGSEYEVPTLIARDGVHPSFPKSHRDYSEESLRSNGYALRSYLTLMAYADVIKLVLKAEPKKPRGQPAAASHPPIPVRFKLDKPAFVTLVIERTAAVEPDSAEEKPDKQHYTGRHGLRVKNLVSNKWFAAGEHTVWWDGRDESNAHTITIPGEAVYYRIDGSLVSAGEYRVRGLTRQAVTPKYEFAVYSGGQSPPWKTKNGRGGWLADHTPPAAALFLPASIIEKDAGPRVLLSSPVAEAGDGLVACDLDGRRVFGRRTVGAGDGWVGGELLARDVGTKRVPKQDVYLAVDWLDRAEVWAIGPHWLGKKIFTFKFSRKEDWAVGGLAVRDGRIALSLPKLDQVLLIDAAKGQLLGKTEVKQPRGLAFDATGRLMVLSARTLTAWEVGKEDSELRLKRTDWQSSASFDDPHGIALDDRGRIYVSDWGKSHQVKVLAPDGKLVRTIGRPGEPRVGPYDPLHMNHPKGLTVASDGRLWVAENWLVPKRVSIWTADGQLVKAMYGPTWYGGGGALDPRDRTRFFVHGDGGGMEFKLDWERGTSELKQIYYLPSAVVDPLEYKLAGKIPPTKSFPQTPVWVGDRLYLSNCFAGDPTNGEPVVYLYHYRDGIAAPVAVLGDPADAAWDILRTEPFRSRWPKGVNPPEPGSKSGNATFVWCDLNDDGKVQPDEVQIVAGSPGSLTLDSELGLTTSTAVRYAPVGFTAKGAPRYDLARGKKLAEGVEGGSGQVIAVRDGWTVFTFPPKPLPGCYLAGAKDGKLSWTYPEEFLGLHNSHHSKPPKHPGDVIGTTRLLGHSFLAPRTGDRKAEPIELWAINGNYGNVYLFTTDGLLAATLFQDNRIAKSWPNEERRGFEAKDVSLDEECFFPSIQQMTDGRVYLVAGKSFSGIFEITGLDTIRRLPEQKLTVTAKHVAEARRYLDARPRPDDGAKEPEKKVPDKPEKESK